MTISNSNTTPDLRALAKQYRVLWDILPKRLPVSMNGHRIGFEIELWATHSHPVDVGLGECFDCRRALDVLSRIAATIAPVECDFRMMRGVPVDSRVSVHPRDGFGRIVRLGIEVVCRSGRPAVAEQCDAGCLLAMREKLIALGARRI